MLDLLLMAIAFTIIFIIIVCFAIHVEKTNKFNNQLPTMMHRRIKIDKDFSDFEKKEIINALDEWKHATCHLFDYTIVDNELDDIYKDNNNFNTIVILRSSSKEKLVQQIDYSENMTIYAYAFYSQPNVILMVMDRLGSANKFCKVLVHELGHALFIPHINRKNSIMSKYYNGKNTMTYNDLLGFLSCCQWDNERVKYENDKFWFHEKSNYRSNRLKRFYEYKE